MLQRRLHSSLRERSTRPRAGCALISPGSAAAAPPPHPPIPQPRQLFDSPPGSPTSRQAALRPAAPAATSGRPAPLLRPAPLHPLHPPPLLPAGP
jgi:hypothetical protein